LKFSLNLYVDGQAEELIGFLQRAEAAGFDRVWTQEGDRSALTSAALLAPHAKQIKIATGVAHAFTRPPYETARMALDIARYAKGRFALGLGTGARPLVERQFGMVYERPVGRLREYVRFTRELMDGLAYGKQVRLEGDFYRAGYDGQHEVMPEGLAPPPDVHLGVLGPQMSFIAGQVADGLLGGVMGTPSWMRDVVWPNVRRGQEAAGRAGTSFEMTATLVCAISNDRAQARHDTARFLAWYATRESSWPAFDWHGFGAAVRPLKGKTIDEAAGLIPDDLIDAFAAAGTRDEARKGIERFGGIAESLRVLPPPHVLSAAEMDVYQDAILETFGC
jgi:probable F420-dependent oxidoreductase